MSRILRIPALDSATEAIDGVRAAAVAALELDYAGLAAALEDLAAVLTAIPVKQARAIADAMFSREPIDKEDSSRKLDQMIRSNDQVWNG